MADFISLFFRFWQSIFDLLSYYRFDIGGFSVTLTELFICFLIISMVISVFWKGARA